MATHDYQRSFRIFRRLVAMVGVTSVSYEYSKLLHPSSYIPSLPNLTKENNTATERHYRLLKQVCADMGLEPADTPKIRLCYSGETKELTSSFSQGALEVPSFLDLSSRLDKPGVVIALPRCTSFTSRADMEEADVFHDRPVDWDSTLGKRIELSLNMSREDILKFKLAQELSFTKHRHNFLYHTSACTAFAYLFVAGMSRWPYIKHFYGSNIFVAMIFLGWAWSRQYIWKWLDYLGDEEAALLGKEYCRGGLFYYFHTVMYNLVLRDIDMDGFTVYNAEGEKSDQYFRPKIEERVEKLMLMKQSLEEQVPISVDVEPKDSIILNKELTEPKDCSDSQGSIEPPVSVGYKLF